MYVIVHIAYDRCVAFFLFLFLEVGEVDNFLGQDPPNSSSSILGLPRPLSSADTDSKAFTTLLTGHPQPSGFQDLFEEAQNLQAQPQPPQGYAPQPFSIPHPQPFSVTHPLPPNSQPSYARPSSPVLQVAPIFSTTSQALPPSPPRADEGAPGQWSYQSPQHDFVIGTTLLHHTADPVHSTSDTDSHQAAPLFQTSPSPTSSSPSQLQHGYELQSPPSSSSSSSASSSIPLLATSQYQEFQPVVKQEGSISQSIPTSFPPVATVAPLGKFPYQDMHTFFKLVMLSFRCNG
jgi:hypothetical protein